ncbi:MAG: DUF4105 domain-containing protein [Flavipsychrobacter sp.]|nr:DUF4105 domain-containing protein [Flavipsychrobacter sp.]
MLRKLFLVFVAMQLCLTSFAQADSSHLRISLLTCGVGDEIWETFGHDGVRIIDSAHHTDMVYNYGTFNGFDKGFELAFMRGKLLYYLSYGPFPEFMQEYVDAHRKVQEQVFDMTGAQKQQVYAFLQNNAQEENRYYKYDFFFDNCATRIRDILPDDRVFGSKFHYGNVLPPNSSISFRDIINKYFYRQLWERFGINILLGSKIDRIMTNKDIMFLPDFLRDGLDKATVDGRRVVTAPKTILDGSPVKPAEPDGPLVVTSIIAILTISGLFIKRLRVLGVVMSSLLLMVTGLLGILVLVMWFGTDHQGCSNNYSLLWALPTNVILAFTMNRKKGNDRYALIAILLLIASLLVHILHIQQMLLVEMSPLLLSLLCVYGTIYKRSRLKAVV